MVKVVPTLSPRGLTYLCTEKAGYINSAPLYICRVVLFLLRQRRGAGLVFGKRRGAGLGELQRARGRSDFFATAPANTSRALHGAHPKFKAREVGETT